jgi:apolipoprotein N-acyltransferase
MSVFRAVENHVPLARCANTGLTLVADSNGRVRARAPVFEPAVLVARLSRPGPPTLFTRIGDWPGAVAVVVVAALFAAPLARRLTARGDAK